MKDKVKNKRKQEESCKKYGKDKKTDRIHRRTRKDKLKEHTGTGTQSDKVKERKQCNKERKVKEQTD